MEKDHPPKTHVRMGRRDFVASLVRAESYLKDYESFRNGQGPAPYWAGGSPKYDPRIWLLERWPLLREPIPPDEARKSPENFIGNVIPAVLLPHEEPDGWEDRRVLTAINWPSARIIPVWINLERPSGEILDDMAAKLRILGLPVKESSPKKDIRDSWEIWDTFAGAGGMKIRKTAETIFKDSFQYRNDRRELKAEAKKIYEEKLKKERRHKAETWHDNYLARATAAAWRVKERQARRSYVRAVVSACRKKIEAHSPTEKK